MYNILVQGNNTKIYTKCCLYFAKCLPNYRLLQVSLLNYLIYKRELYLKKMIQVEPTTYYSHNLLESVR